MRKKNIFWNLDNDIHLFGYVYSAFKVTVITLTDVSISLCLLSLVVWYYHRQMRGGCVGRQEKVMEYSIYNYVAAADISVLVYLVVGESKWAFGLWVLLILSSLAHCILTLYRERIDKLHLPDCEAPPE